MLGKYRSLSTAVDLCRVIDVLENRRFYVSPVDGLNDPLEGRGMKLHLTGYAGISIALNAGEMPVPMRDSLGRFGVLCLTADCRNPQMWVHYADGFTGVCICVHKSGRFSEAQSVEYCDSVIHTEEILSSPSQVDETMSRSLLIKKKGWDYEKEWRIIRKRRNKFDPEYFNFKGEDLAAVVLGHRANSEVAALIRSKCEQLEIPLYKTRIVDLSNRVEIVPHGFEVEDAGAHFDDQLTRYCETHRVPPFSDFEAANGEA